MHFPAANSPENRTFSPLNMQLLMLFLMFFTAKAQSPTGHVGMSSGDVVTNFQPSLGVVVGVLAILFSLTFVLLVFAKCCHRRSPANHLQNRILSRSRSRYSGIDKTVIESLPFFRFSALKGSRQGLECAVCLSKFEDIEILRLLPKCKHAFHIDCVDQWLEKHSSCPLCRHKVSTDDIAWITYSTSLRFLQSQSDLRQDSNLELFVQREEDFDQGSSRFSRGSSFKGMKEEELPIQESCHNNENCEEILHKFNHRIIISDVVLKNRWSSVSSSDLMFLNSEMINAVSSNRFSSKEPENEQFATTKRIGDGDQIMKIKEEMNRKILLENKLSKINQTGLIPFSGLTSDANPGTTSKILDPTEKRSMSEIIVHPRFTEFSMRNSTELDSSCPENNVKEERLRRLWLPIARRTVHWFANREKRSPISQQNTRQSLDV